MARGTDSFYEEFIENNKGTIYKICRVYANDQDELKDFVQEVTIQLWRSKDKFENRSKLSTWIYRVTLNVCLTLSKRNQKRVDTVELLSSDYHHDDDGIEQEQVAALYSAVRKLKEADRALVLLYLEDKSYQEIGDILGMTISNVGVKINRVKTRLKELIDGGA